MTGGTGLTGGTGPTGPTGGVSAAFSSGTDYASSGVNPYMAPSQIYSMVSQGVVAPESANIWTHSIQLDNTTYPYGIVYGYWSYGYLGYYDTYGWAYNMAVQLHPTYPPPGSDPGDVQLNYTISYTYQ